MRGWMMAAALVACMASTAARAQDADEIAFAAGQFTCAATVCGVPRAEVMPLAKAMLEASGVDPNGPSPAMTRFTEGVASGTREQKDTPQATCDEVKDGFKQMQAHMPAAK